MDASFIYSSKKKVLFKYFYGGELELNIVKCLLFVNMKQIEKLITQICVKIKEDITL